MFSKLVTRLLWVLCLGAAVFVGWKAYQRKQATMLPEGIASGNGRIEAIQVDVSAKEPGRIREILAREGDLVEPGQVVARMDIATLEAELAKAKASVATAQEREAVARSSIVRRESEKKLAESEFSRVKSLYTRKVASREEYDQKDAALRTAAAAVDEENARLRTATQQVEVEQAEVRRIQTRIDDSVLKAPVKGRVLYRLAEEGEVLSPGGKVLTLLNLTDIYMEIFLPATQAAQVKIGDEARIVFDARPDRAAPAKVTFVSPEAQFTPKQVETRSERDKLMFRVKIQIPPDLILPYIDRVKTGIRGVGYVKYRNDLEWPAFLPRVPSPDQLPPPSKPAGPAPERKSAPQPATT
ncbi:MAG: HlyD family efflux transporter periplasmic adaptor subunit [Isosphaeraceae bacterium]